MDYSIHGGELRNIFASVSSIFPGLNSMAHLSQHQPSSSNTDANASTFQSNEQNMLELADNIIQSLKNRDVIFQQRSELAVLNGFRFCKDNQSSDERVQYWSCSVKTCKVRAQSPIGSTQLSVLGNTEHSHLADPCVSEECENHNVEKWITRSLMALNFAGTANQANLPFSILSAKKSGNMRKSLSAYATMTTTSNEPPSPSPSPLLFSNQGKEIAVLNGHQYRKDKVNSSGSLQYWRCIVKGCHGRAQSPFGTANLCVRLNQHNHLPDFEAIEARRQSKDNQKTIESTPSPVQEPLLPTSSSASATAWLVVNNSQPLHITPTPKRKKRTELRRYKADGELVSIRGREIATLNGFKYRKDKINVAGNVQFWRCLVSGCHGRAQSTVGSLDISVRIDNHNHAPDWTQDCSSLNVSNPESTPELPSPTTVPPHQDLFSMISVCTEPISPAVDSTVTRKNRRCRRSDPYPVPDVSATPSPVHKDLLSNKGREIATLDGHQYRKDKLSTDGTAQFWRCVVKGCRGRAQSALGSTDITPRGDSHNHDANVNAIEMRERSNHVKVLARSSDVSVRQIVESVLDGASEDFKTQIKSDSLSRQANRLRKLNAI